VLRIPKVVEALLLWRRFPTQIEADLRIHCHGLRIADWHQGRMSSRELLVLVHGLPDTSKYKEAAQRTLRVVLYCGEGEHKGKLFLTPAIGKPSRDVVTIAEYIDWTFEQKLLARNAREVASMRNDGRDTQPDLTGLIEPLQQILLDRERRIEEQKRTGVQRHIHAGLYATTKGGE
jgi:hypothetical protein